MHLDCFGSLVNPLRIELEGRVINLVRIPLFSVGSSEAYLRNVYGIEISSFTAISEGNVTALVWLRFLTGLATGRSSCVSLQSSAAKKDF